MIIKDYNSYKLINYIQPNKKYLIIFKHGLGDTIMFYPIFEWLVNTYRSSTFHLYTEIGQEEIFGKYTIDEKLYNICFEISYKMSEYTKNHTKNTLCCENEIGISVDTYHSQIEKNICRLPNYSSPLIACHFQGTCLPRESNCDSDVAKRIWNKIIDHGFIPIECHYEHIFHNPINKKYDFIDNNIRTCKPKISSLIGLLRHCRGFIGIVSGPFHIAYNLYPERVCLLQKKFKMNSLYNTNINHKLDLLQPYNDNIITTFLNSL